MVVETGGSLVGLAVKKNMCRALLLGRGRGRAEHWLGVENDEIASVTPTLPENADLLGNGESNPNLSGKHSWVGGE